MRFILSIIALGTAMLAVSIDAQANLWEWYETETVEGEFITPESEGYTLYREFLSNLVYNEYVDGELVQTSSYTIITVRIWPNIYIEVIYIMKDGREIPYGYSLGDGPVLTLCSDFGAEDRIPSYPCERYVPAENVSTEKLTWSTVKSLYR